MTKILIISLGSILALPVLGQSKTVQYCSNVGPVELTINGETVTGKYLITVTPSEVKGTLTGRIEEGLIDGLWDDPDGKGRIIIALSGDLNTFTAVYNTNKNPAHWYSEWTAICTTEYAALAPDKQKAYSCALKK